MKKLVNEKGVITILTLVTVLFMLSFLITSYILVSNKVRTQKEILNETSNIYEPKFTMEEIYNSYFTKNEIIPIFNVDQLLKIATGGNISINEKIYTFSNEGTYLLMNDLVLNEEEWQEILQGNEWKPIDRERSFEGEFDYNNHTITVLRTDGSTDKYDGRIDYVEGMVLWLDGIQNTRQGHINNLSVWEDLSGNNYDYNMIGVTTTDKSVLFDGSENSYGELYDPKLITQIFGDSFNSPLTIQAVFNRKSSQFVDLICSNINIGKALRTGYNQNKLILTNYIGYGSGNRWIIDKSSKIQSISITFGDNFSAYEKANMLETYDIFPGNSVSSTSRIGRWYNGGEVEIYSLRVYPRQLTDEEIWQNFLADSIRFRIKKR